MQWNQLGEWQFFHPSPSVRGDMSFGLTVVTFMNCQLGKRLFSQHKWSYLKRMQGFFAECDKFPVYWRYIGNWLAVNESFCGTCFSSKPDTFHCLLCRHYFCKLQSNNNLLQYHVTMIDRTEKCFETIRCTTIRKWREKGIVSVFKHSSYWLFVVFFAGQRRLMFLTSSSHHLQMHVFCW